MPKKELQAQKKESKSYCAKAMEWIAAYKTHTVYLIAIITVTFTIAVLPLFRLIAQQDGGNKSKAADAAYYVLSDIFGMGIIVYPWWLATSKSPLYYSRLRYFGRIMGVIVVLLAGIQGIFTPDKPFDKNDPEKTSFAYKIIYSLDVVAILGGFLIALPIWIRRDRLFKSNSRSLFRFAWLFTAIMIVGLLLRRWMGFSRIVSFSCVFLVVQFFVLDVVEEIERQAINKTSLFDEAYIIIAGFVPYWIAYAVGNTLLEIVSQAGAIGTVFVFISWRVIIYAFEYLASEVGHKASRYSDGSVFSFAAIYTGATFANFIFLSVTFGSGTFWALLFVTAANIIVVQGGIMIDVDYFFMDYVAVIQNWPLMYTLKMLYFEKIRVIPHAMAKKIVNCGENLTPEIKLALIRSRAKVLQLNWVHNDIKMASEFQALACAGTAVAFEIVYSYYGIGSDSITANLDDRMGALYIYCVNILFSFFAQFIARRRLRQKVLRLKKEISATVKALDSTTMRGSISADRSSISSTTSADYRNSTHSTKQRNPASRRGSMFSALTSAFSRHGFGSSTDLQGLDGADTAQADLEERGSDGEESHMLISEQDVDTDALNAILGLCNLYATEEMQEMESQEAERSKTGPPSPLKTMTSQPFSSRRSGRNGEGDAEQGAETRRFGKIRFVRGQGSEVDDPNIDEGEDDGWEEVHLNTNRLSTHFRSSFGGAAGGSGVGFKRRMTSMFGGLAGGTGERRGSGDPAEEVLVSSNAVRMQGYLNKRKPGTTSVYQRRFFLLTDKQLMWFASEDDVEQHINRRKGAINIAQITNLDRYDPISLCILNIAVHSGRVYVLMAIDRSCADDWYDMIQECRQNLSKTKKNIVAGKRTSDAANDIDGEKLESRPSTSGTKVSFLPWFGGGGGEAADDGDSDARQDPPGGARTKNRPSSTFSLGFGVAHDDIHERVDEENDGGGVVQMLRRGTTSARRGLGSIFHAAAGAIPLVTAGNADGSAGAAPAESTEAWRAGWDTSDLPRKMGYMQKMGEINATWQQRWFVIEESGNLTWYDKAGAERHQKPKGCISIGEVVCIKGVDSDNPRLIEIRHIHGRVYQLEAGSELDATDWRSVLEQWVLSARVAIDKYNSENRDKLALDSNNQNSSTTYDQDQDDEEESKVPENTDSTPSGPQRKTGSMRKRGGTRNAAFKKRWFVLDHPGVLSWFEKVNGDKFGKPKGSINMGDVMCILAASYDSPCLVEVRHVEGRVYELEADSVQEAEDWRKALNVWLKFAYDLKKEQKITGAHAKAVPATEPKAGEFAGEDLGVTSSTDISAGDGKSSNTDVIKKRYFMYSKLGFSRGKGRGEPKGVSYAPVSVESGADPKRSPGSPVMELDDVYPQLTATERVEALTRERDNGVPDIATANGRGVSFITPTKSNPLFQSGSTFNMMPEAKVRGDESEDEEVTKFQQSSGTDLHSATSAEEQTSSRGSSPSLASAPSIASTPSMAPRSGRRARGPRRGSTVFSEICAQVAAQAPAQLAPTSTATNSAAMTNDEEVVPAYNRHRASIDSAIEERKKGMASQSISQQRALRHQATKRQNLIGEKKKIIHRESELADSKFMRRMAKRHSSELVDNLQKKSYKDMNSEFWATHTWYLACVVCFVTLNVLYSTSYIVSQY